MFQDMKGLSITFIGEPAIDDGGPLCELFRLLMLEIERMLASFVVQKVEGLQHTTFWLSSEMNTSSLGSA